MSIQKITITDFINNQYKDYWKYSNKNGKNSVDPREQVSEVVRRIIYSSYKLGIKPNDEVKTTTLQGEVVKVHPHGDSSIQDSIKGVATAYKSQPATRLLRGVGNFGAIPGDDGAAARYTAISGTPLMSKIYQDLPFVPYREDEGENQPEFVSMPIPMSLINGMSSIGTGKSCYLAERDAKCVIDWIKEMSDTDDWAIKAPEAISVTGCDTWFDSNNGYIYYQAIIHSGVDANDLSKRGKFDVITALPPKITPQFVIEKLQTKLPVRATKQNNIIDGTGEGRGVWIIVPHGYLDPQDYTKFGLKTARKEQVIIWDNEKDLPYVGNINDIAREWFNSRCNVVTKRLENEIKDLEKQNHRINLIKIFADNSMQKWNSEDIRKFYIELANDEKSGTEDANLVLGTPQRAFLPENISDNEITKEKNNKQIKNLKSNIKNIGDFIIEEAYDIIDKQEKFFAEI